MPTNSGDILNWIGGTVAASGTAPNSLGVPLGVFPNGHPYPPPALPPEPANNFTFNIVILADGKSLGSQSDELAAKIGKAIAAAMAMKDAQGMVEELSE